MLPDRFIVMISRPWKQELRQIVLLQLEDDFQGRPKFAGKNATGIKRILFRSDQYPGFTQADHVELARVERVARALNDSRLALMEIELHADATQRLRRYVMDLYDEAGGA